MSLPSVSPITSLARVVATVLLACGVLGAGVGSALATPPPLGDTIQTCAVHDVDFDQASYNDTLDPPDCLYQADDGHATITPSSVAFGGLVTITWAPGPYGEANGGTATDTLPFQGANRSIVGLRHAEPYNSTTGIRLDPVGTNCSESNGLSCTYQVGTSSGFSYAEGYYRVGVLYGPNYGGFGPYSGAAGTFDVQLHVGDNQPPVPNLNVSREKGLTYLFDASESTDDGQISDYDYTVDGKEVAGAGLNTTDYTFPSVGTYKVAVTVTDNADISRTAEKTVEVTPDPANQTTTDPGTGGTGGNGGTGGTGGNAPQSTGTNLPATAPVTAPTAPPASTTATTPATVIPRLTAVTIKVPKAKQLAVSFTSATAGPVSGELFLSGKGWKSGGACVNTGKKPKSAKPCTAFFPVSGAKNLKPTAKAGANTTTLKTPKLAAGKYQLTIDISSADGEDVSATGAFTVKH